MWSYVNSIRRPCEAGYTACETGAFQYCLSLSFSLLLDSPGRVREGVGHPDFTVDPPPMPQNPPPGPAGGQPRGTLLGWPEERWTAFSIQAAILMAWVTTTATSSSKMTSK